MDAIAPAETLVDLKALAAKLVADQVEWDKLHPDSETALQMALTALEEIRGQVKAGRGDALRIALEEANAGELAEAVEEIMEEENA